MTLHCTCDEMVGIELLDVVVKLGLQSQSMKMKQPARYVSLIFVWPERGFANGRFS
jgi:hypothetical protein